MSELCRRSVRLNHLPWPFGSVNTPVLLNRSPREFSMVPCCPSALGYPVGQADWPVCGDLYYPHAIALNTYNISAITLFSVFGLRGDTARIDNNKNIQYKRSRRSVTSHTARDTTRAHAPHGTTTWHTALQHRTIYDTRRCSRQGWAHTLLSQPRPGPQNGDGAFAILASSSSKTLFET